VNAQAGTRIVTVLVVILAASVLVETLLFRIFARGGVYFISEATPAVIKNGYTSLVFSGNTLFNFAAPVALLVLGLIAVMAWMKRPDPTYTLVAGAVGLVAVIGLVMMIGMSGPFLSTAYYAASSLILIAAFALAIRRRVGYSVTAFVLLTGLSYLAIYSFKGFGSPELAGVGIRSVGVYALGEWMGVIAFLALLPLLIGRRGRLSRRAVVIASVVSLLAFGMAFGRADSVPLIANWAFGLTLSLPYVAYAAGLWVVVAFVVSGARRGEVILAAGVLLVMLGHRSIPLTYFNDLVLVGVLLASMYSSPVAERALGRVNAVVAEPSYTSQ
jgi:hypothetical protein